jgi:poly-gamma-glutamate capsule biosynthesis protein CapA/YwtB (metallophosphatase superfamily)
MRIFLRAGILLGLTTSALMAQRSAPTVPDPRSEIPATRKPASVRNGFTLTTIGELLYSRSMANSPDTALQSVFRLLRAGDVTIGNQEALFHDKASFKGTGYGNSLLRGEAGIAEDEKALGFDLITLANNHTLDWGVEGILETQRLLSNVGIATAGAGRNRTEAFAPGYFQAPRGRVALIGATSTINNPYSDANDATDEAPARPGAAVLRLRRVNLIAPELHAELRAVIAKLNPGRAGGRAEGEDITFGGATYRASATPGMQHEMNAFDHAQILRSIREGKQSADLAVFTIHAHETGGGDAEDPAIPAFLVELFHNAVDAGADVILGHGPHFLRGIEIYKGKPILYGIGAFFLSGDIAVMGNAATANAYHRRDSQRAADAPPSPPRGTAESPPPGMRIATAGGNPAQWYDGLVVNTVFDGDRVKEVRLYPLDLGNTYALKRRGLPHFASPENARRILTKLQALSARFGTRIEVEESVGVIRLM